MIAIRPEMLTLLKSFAERRYKRSICQAKAARSLASLKIGAKRSKKRHLKEMTRDIIESEDEIDDSVSEASQISRRSRKIRKL